MKREKLKFIADVNIEKPIIDHLLSRGYDVKWVPDYDCEMDDISLLNLANTEKRILLTNDKDFGELIFLQNQISTGIVLFRIKGQKTKEKVRLLNGLLAMYSDKIINYYVVATEKKIRFIPMEDIT